MKIFIINLDKDKTKWEKMRQLWGDFDIHRISATNGREISSDKVSTLCNIFCTAGMKGCFDSHRRVWKKVVEEKIPYVLVLEDDVEPVDNFQNKLENVLKQLPKNWDICNLQDTGYNEGFNITDIPYVGLCKIFSLPNSYTTSISEDLCIPYISTQTCAYLLSNKGATQLLSLFPKVFYHVDFCIFSTKNNLNIYASKKRLVTHDMTKSEMASKGYVTEFMNNITVKENIPLGFILGEPLFQMFGIYINLQILLLVVIFLCLLSIYNKNWKILYIGIIILILILVVILKSMDFFRK
jgi:GR25 family glycosyltransferase involved in LPS biosynthesis